MIAANIQAARFLAKHRMPALYRVHQGVAEDRLESLHEFLSALGLKLGGGLTPKPHDFSQLLKKVTTRPDAELIEMVMLRSMTQAVYQPQNIGHFGLALSEYAHFTSPIRRYPDLLVHRAIRHIVRGGKTRSFGYGATDIERLGIMCSTYERRADDATRNALDWLKTEFMQDKIGEEFDGMISGVTDFGLFVRLNDLQIEGLVHVSALSSDYYQHDPVHHRLYGERNGMEYRLTDPIRIRVVRASLEDKKIDFEPVGGPKRKSKAKGSDKTSGKKRTGKPKKAARKRRRS
jgi:ribonuclease R